MPIYVYKTNVAYAGNGWGHCWATEKMPGVVRCNFDLADVDKILRVEVTTLLSPTVEQAVQAAGFFCKELDD